MIRPIIVALLQTNCNATSFLLFHSRQKTGKIFEEIKSMPDENKPHVVLMDLEMPYMDGVAAIATASSLYPQIKFVVLTIFDDDDKIFRAIRAGACGYLLKEESGPVITEMLMSLWESGAGPISPSIAYKILQMMQQPNSIASANTKEASGENLFQLSDREREVLQLLSEGLDYKEIAAKTFISPNTVKNIQLVFIINFT